MTQHQTTAALDWEQIETSLDEAGCAVTPPLLDADACAALRACYDSDGLFRSKVVMSRHGFGRGEYKYFAYPLPKQVEALRTAGAHFRNDIVTGFGGKQILLDDPAGNPIELFEPPRR